MTLEEEYGRAWTQTPLPWCEQHNIPWELIRHFGVVGADRVVIEGRRYQPHRSGKPAMIIAVRGNSDGDIEADDPFALVTGGPVLDLLAIPLDGLDQWALRRGSVTFMGAVEPQFVNPPPIRLHRNPLNWLRSGCDGIALLTDDPREKFDIISRLWLPAAEDAAHGRELQRILAYRWRAPQVVVARRAA